MPLPTSQSLSDLGGGGGDLQPCSLQLGTRSLQRLGEREVMGGNTTFFFPIVTCIALSLVLTVVVNVVLWLLSRRP